MMNMTSKKIRLLAALTVLMLLLLPAGIALADPTDSQPPTDTPTPSATSSGSPVATSELEPMIVRLVSKAKTEVWDDNDTVIGQIAKGEKVIQYTAEKMKPVDVVEIVLDPDEILKDWLCEIKSSNEPIAVVPVLITLSQDSTANPVRGWIEKAVIENWDTLNYKLLLAKITETPIPSASPTSSPMETMVLTTGVIENQNQTEGQQIQGETNVLMNLLQKNFWMLIAFCAICVMGLIVIVWILQQIFTAQKRQERINERGNLNLKEAVGELTKPISANGDKLSDLSKNSSALSNAADEISKDVKQIKKLIGPPPPVLPSWETLVRFANSVTKIDRLEEWQDAFRSKSWEVKSIQPAFDLPGYYEIAKFDSARYLAAFILETAEGKNCIVIPSCNDTFVQSSDVLKLFKITGGEPSNGTYYEILQPAILFSDNNRHYRVKEHGKLIISRT